jgi:signal transduction histidine kinase/ActR/RegA family two-component response regulator
MTPRIPSDEDRVLVLMPTEGDAARTVAMLGELSLRAVACNDLPQVCCELRRGASAVLLTDDAIINDATGQLAEAARAQPSWSAVPHVVLAREASGPHLSRVISDALTNVIIVERPVHTRTLLSVVLSALRGRHHQYEIRDAILARERQAAALMAQEEQLRQSQAELARQADQLRTEDARKNEFLATLAHELRNPLAPIQTGLDLLSETPRAESVGPTLAVMGRQLKHMVRLIDDLLDVARITQGKLELRREEVRLGSVMQAAIESSQPLIDAGGHTLELSLPSQEYALHADFTRIAQVISNLLNNAAKYTPRGGTIGVTARVQGAEVTIEVRDNGMGIPSHRLDDVFTMFSQVSRSLDHSKGGLGIGLALVRRLVEMHGGSVSAASEGAGKGSIFTVKLPCRAQRAADVEPRKDAERRADGTLVLVVDDNEDAAELLSMMLQLSGHHTQTAHDGEGALASARALMPQAIILDIGLPDMSGYDVARALRQDARFANTALIALTGWGSNEDKRKAMSAGFDFHLTKPVNAQDMKQVLQRVTASASR